MYDLMSQIGKATKGDTIILKMLIQQKGYIVGAITPLYFVQLDRANQHVDAALDVALTNVVQLPLRAIQTIRNSSHEVIYEADIRDNVYGI